MSKFLRHSNAHNSGHKLQMTTINILKTTNMLWKQNLYKWFLGRTVHQNKTTYPSSHRGEGAGAVQLATVPAPCSTPWPDWRKAEEGHKRRTAMNRRMVDPNTALQRCASPLLWVVDVGYRGRGGDFRGTLISRGKFPRFKLTAKFPTRNSGFSANFWHPSGTHCGLWRGVPHKIQGAPRNFPQRNLPPRI